VNKVILILFFAISSLTTHNVAYANNELGLLSSTPGNLKYDIKDFPMLSDLTFTSDIEKSSLEIALYKEYENQDAENVSNMITYNEKKYKFLYELKKTVTNASYLSNFITPEISAGKYLISWKVNQCTGDCLLLSNDNATRVAAAEAFPKKGQVAFEVSNSDKKYIMKNKYLILIAFPPLLLLFWFLRKK
jgi:hypothetical protein